MLNGENTAQFQLNLSNEGDEPQDVIVSMQKIGKNFVVKDTTGKILKKNYMETTLKPYSDTTISYNIQILDQPKYPLIDQRKSLLFLMVVGAMIGLFIGLMASVYIYTDK
jgi:hypothetical protein